MGYTVKGQVDTTLKSLLQEGDYLTFRKQLKTISEYTWEVLPRTVVSDYKEELIHLTDTKGTYYRHFKIYLLSTDKKIIYYKLCQLVYVGENSEENEKIIDEKTDTSSYKAFLNSFQQTYQTPPAAEDLFSASIVYGDYCGLAGIMPPYRAALNKMIQQKEISELRKWLKSANAEKQLYALEAYKQLIEQDYSISEEELRVITVLAQKKGFVNTCGGCSRLPLPFEKIYADIGLMPLIRYRRTHAYLRWTLLCIGITTLVVLITNRLPKKTSQRNFPVIQK